MYDITAAQAERDAQRAAVEPFQFMLDGRAWQLRHPAEMPASSVTWTGVADYAANADVAFAPILGEGEEPVPFPINALTAEQFDALVAAGIRHYLPGSSVGESKPPTS